MLAADLDLPTLLRHFVEEACSITGARYGALGVLNDERTALEEFITVGLTRDEELRIGARPTGQGVLGLLITDPRPMRLADLSDDPDSSGFPPGHPPMTSFLGAPIKVRDEVYGNLYLTDKVGWSEFTRDDEALVGALALTAGIAIENARLHRLVQAAAVYDDRERVARDLHDSVIQRIFAAGLSLQSMAAPAAAAGMSDRLNAVISDLDDTIKKIRQSIFDLTSADFDRGIRASISSLISELNPVVGFEVAVSFDGPVDSAISDQVAEHLVVVVREAITNIGRHAEATEATVTVSVEDGLCHLYVLDNGRGFDPTEMNETNEGGLGLPNLRRRAEKLNGKFFIERPAGGGSLLTWQVPLGT